MLIDRFPTGPLDPDVLTRVSPFPSAYRHLTRCAPYARPAPANCPRRAYRGGRIPRSLVDSPQGRPRARPMSENRGWDSGAPKDESAGMGRGPMDNAPTSRNPVGSGLSLDAHGRGPLDRKRSWPSGLSRGFETAAPVKLKPRGPARNLPRPRTLPSRARPGRRCIERPPARTVDHAAYLGGSAGPFGVGGAGRGEWIVVRSARNRKTKKGKKTALSLAMGRWAAARKLGDPRGGRRSTAVLGTVASNREALPLCRGPCETACVGLSGAPPPRKNRPAYRLPPADPLRGLVARFSSNSATGTL